MKKPTFILNNQCLRNNDAIEVKITLKNNMLLKVIALVVCLLCVLSAAACNSSVELSDAPNGSSKNNKENTVENQDDMSGRNGANNMNSALPVQSPVPPLQMGSICEIVSVLKSSDTQGYREEFQTEYNELFAVLKSCGFIYSVTTTENTTAADAVTFLVKDGNNIFFVMPYARYEDAGIVSYVMFRGALYQVCVYTADTKVLAQAKTISEYIKTRTGRDVLNETASGKNTVCFMTDGTAAVDQKNYAASFIDDNHYYVVSTEASQGDLNTFLSALNFEKISVE